MNDEQPRSLTAAADRQPGAAEGRGADALPPGVVKILRARPVYARYAGFASRTMAMVIDLLIIGMLLTIWGIAANFVARTSGIGQFVGVITEGLTWLKPIAGFFASPAFELIVTLGFSFGYFAFFSSVVGATIGKQLMGLRVITAEGRPLTTAQAVLRTLAYVPAALALYLGFLAVLVDDRRRGWHDHLARTVVVHQWRARADERFLREAVDSASRRPFGPQLD